VNVVPCPGGESTSTRPRCASTAAARWRGRGRYRPPDPSRTARTGGRAGSRGCRAIVAHGQGHGASMPAPPGSSWAAGRPVRTTTARALPVPDGVQHQVRHHPVQQVSSPSMGVASPARSMTGPGTVRVLAHEADRRGRHGAQVERPALRGRARGEKSRNSESRRDSRSVSRTTRDVGLLVAFTRFARPSCSTDERIDASGFLISCARLADSSAPPRAVPRAGAAPRAASSREMSVKIAVTRGSPAGSRSSVVVVTPIGKVRSGRRTVASTRIARTPRRAVAVIAARTRGRSSRTPA